MKKLLTILTLCLILCVASGCKEDESATPKVPVDYDLTKYTAQIASATVTDMNEHPEKYVGKTIRLRGTLMPEFFEELDRDINWVLIDDDSGCCFQYIEIKKNDGDYPPDNSKIEITGTFGLYSEGIYSNLSYLAVKDLSIRG